MFINPLFIDVVTYYRCLARI